MAVPSSSMRPFYRRIQALFTQLVTMQVSSLNTVTLKLGSRIEPEKVAEKEKKRKSLRKRNVKE